MKLATIALACLMAAAPLAGQATSGKKWSFGLYGDTPGLGLYLHQLEDGSQTNFDAKKDLGLKSNGLGLGARIDYLGPRGGFQLDVGFHDFAGQRRMTEPTDVGGTTFEQGTEVTSSLKNTMVDFTGTIKVLRFEHFWLGIDLGLQAWVMQVQAEAKNTSTAQREDDDGPVSYSLPLPIPQLGLSCGAKALDNALEFRGRVHLLAYSGATYTLFAADARYYFLPWLGARAFVENQRFDVPFGSVQDDLEARIDNNRFGIGLSLRW
jgi:hypothetical protein